MTITTDANLDNLQLAKIRQALIRLLKSNNTLVSISIEGMLLTVEKELGSLDVTLTIEGTEYNVYFTEVSASQNLCPFFTV